MLCSLLHRPFGFAIIAVPHQIYKSGGWAAIANLMNRKDGLVVDIKSMLDRAQKPADVKLWRV
jgi:hypothetical protein